MIGYLIEQELGNLLPFEKPFATILTMVEVDPHDPAFADPTKFIGPVYPKEEAERLASEKGWAIKPDGDKWRRVVASPEPKRIFEIRPVRWLLEHGSVVICAGGGGIPTMYEPGTRTLVGAELRRRRVERLAVGDEEEKRLVEPVPHHVSQRRAVDVHAGPAARVVGAELQRRGAAIRVAERTHGAEIEASRKPADIGGIQRLQTID